MNTPSYFSILPAKVRFDKELTDFQKLLFAEITSLSNAWGYCTASNSYLGGLYGKDPTTISRSVSKLQSRGFINVEFKGNDSAQRRIYPLVDAKSQPQGVDENVKGGV